jgi:acylphosphatase
MQARIFISGMVQGIGFRWFVKWNARKLKLTGWVKNTSDGGVEALAQGEKEAIEKLVKFCEKGPFLSDVKSVQVEWEKEGESFKDFKTTH